MPGERFRDACHSICRWLLSMNATADLAACPAKCPLMLAAGSGNADFVELLLNARASVEANEGGPSLDAVLSAVFNTKGDGLNQARMIRCLQSRGCTVNWPHLGQGGGTASRRSSSAAVTRHGQAVPSTPASTASLWAGYRAGVAQPMMAHGWVPGPGAASPFLASAGAAPAQQGAAGIAPARAPAPAVAAPAVVAPAVAAPAIAAPQVAAPGAAAPAVAVKAPPPNAAAAPQPPPAAPPPPMAAPAPAAAQPFNWQAAGGGGWGSSASHAQAAGGGGGWGSSASHPSWREADQQRSASHPSWSSSSGARPNVDEADRVWWWSDRYEAWMYSPPGLSPGQGRWAWSACRRFALWFDPPLFTL
jgi:hypothetical protein